MTPADAHEAIADVRIDATGDGATLHVHVAPGAKRAALRGAHGDRLKISIDAPPEGGKANKKLIAFLGGVLGVPRSRLAIVSGATSRQKRLAVAGLSPAEVRAALEKALANG